MQDQDAVIIFKEVIDSLKAGVNPSGKPFCFLAIKLKRPLLPEEALLFLDILKQHRHIGILPLLAPRVKAMEIHLIPDISKSPLPDQTNGTTTTILRVSQMLQRNFTIKGELLFDYSLKPFDERKV